MPPLRLLSVVGARPNFMKMGPLHRAFIERGFVSHIVHTGQHYDAAMSDVFFRQLGLPEPAHYLGVGSGTHAEQTARVLAAVEPVLREAAPDLVVVVGDVNSTLACALAAAKLHLRVVHVEAGLRSGDRRMPEEVNRVLTDQLADELFVTEPSGMDHLRREGRPVARTHLVGNVMIDALVQARPFAAESTVLHDVGVEPGRFVLVTMHRPANVDDENRLHLLVDALRDIAAQHPVVFPLHPRTRTRLEAANLLDVLSPQAGFHLTPPLGYFAFLRLLEGAGVVLTDSGGVQEETTYLGVPCLTLRPSTERPLTITEGTNELLPLTGPNVASRVVARTLERLVAPRIPHTPPPLWDGATAPRIARILQRRYDL